MIDDDPNEAYEVVPAEPGPHGPPHTWWTVKRKGIPVRYFPGKDKAESGNYWGSPTRYAERVNDSETVLFGI
jgi:hypothetical protein